MTARALFRDSAVYGVARALHLGLPILMLPVYARLIAPAEYGVLEILASAGMLLGFVVSVEIGQGLVRYYSETGVATERAGYASTAFWFLVAAWGAVVATGWLGAPWLAASLGEDGGPGPGGTALVLALRAALVAFACESLFACLQNLLRCRGKAKRFSVSAIAYAAVSASASTTLLLTTDWGVAGVFIGQAVGAGSGGALSWMAVRDDIRWALSARHLRRMLVFSAPLVLSSASFFALGFLDRAILKGLVGWEAVGIYGVGFRLASAVSLVLVGVGLALPPLIYRDHQKASLPPLLARLFGRVLAASLMLVVIVSLFAKPILKAAVAPEYLAGAAVVPWLAAAAVFGRLYVFAPGLDLAERTGVIMGINVAGAALNLMLCFVLIPGLGPVGAAVAAFVSALAVFWAYLAFSQRLYPVPHRWLPLAQAVAVCAACVAAGAWVEGSSWESPLVSLGLALAAAASLVATQRR